MPHEDTVGYVLLLALIAAASLFGLWFAMRAWRAGRDVEDTPTSKVRSAAQGYVELVGRSSLPPNARCEAPLSGVACAWWSYTIQRRTAGRRAMWNTVQSGCSATPFFLDDGTGRCLVDPRGAEVFPSSTDVWRGDTGWPATRAGLAGLGGLFPSIFGGEYRYTEHRLYAGEPLYAIGQFRSLGGIALEESPNALSELLRKWKQDHVDLLRRFDANGAGVLEAPYWERARRRARRARRRAQREAHHRRDERPVPTRRRPLISTRGGRYPIPVAPISVAGGERSRLVRRGNRTVCLGRGAVEPASVSTRPWMLEFAR